MEVLLEDKNAVICEGEASFDAIVLDRTSDNKRRIDTSDRKEIP